MSKTSSKFRVVNFVREHTWDGKPVIDLVPTNWLRFTEDNEVLCKYPPAPYINLIALVKKMVEPQTTWKEYAVSVMRKADTYQEGMLKVKDSENTLKETDDDTQKTKVQSTKKSSLEDAPKFPGEQETVSHSPARGDSHSDLSDHSEHTDGSVKRKANRKRTKVDSHSDQSDSTVKPRKKTKVPSDDNWAPDSDSESSLLASILKKQTPSSANNVYSDDDTSKEKTATNNGSSGCEDSDGSKHRRKSSNRKKKQTRDKTESMQTPASNDINKSQKGKNFDMEAYLQGMEKRISSKLDKSKRSLQHGLKKLKEEGLALRVTALKEGGHTAIKLVSDFEKKWEIPFKDTDSFDAFEAELKKEEFKVFINVLESVWVPLGHDQNLRQSVLGIFERYITKEVAVQYSGCGRKKKKNFSKTRFFKALESMMLAVQKDIDTKSLLAEVS